MFIYIYRYRYSKIPSGSAFGFQHHKAGLFGRFSDKRSTHVKVLPPAQSFILENKKYIIDVGVSTVS